MPRAWLLGIFEFWLKFKSLLKDGESGEPIVYHGHTLTSKIFFKDIILAVKEEGFKLSPYPLILTLEMHCSIP